jgi:hypothetical protein
MKTILPSAFLFVFLFSSNAIYAQQTFYDVTAGDGNGVRLWQSDNYKIHMGNAPEYHFGPVWDYSIKMNMSNTPGRGWTWGVNGQTPIAGIDKDGNMQIAGVLRIQNANEIELGTGVTKEPSAGKIAYQKFSDALDIVGAGTGSNRKLKFWGEGGSLFTGNVALVSGAKVAFNNVDVNTSQGEGVTWYAPDPLNYGIFRTPGAWSAPNYQQLRLQFTTGIILDPGTAYGKSYVDVQGGGLRVSSGNLGIGTTTPISKLSVVIPVSTSTVGADPNAYGAYFTDNTSATLAIRSLGNGSMHLTTDGSGRKLILGGGGFEQTLFLTTGGNVGIGTANPDQRLTVNGTIHSKEVKVDLSVPGPDYVFEKDYDLLSLTELETYINQNKHLPEVPSSKEMEKDGLNLKEMNLILLKKVEELTLHLIAQQKHVERIDSENLQLQKRLAVIEHKK